MNILESFAGLLEPIIGATLEQDLFISEAPSSDQVADAIWWVIANGGLPERRNTTGEKVKAYQVEVYYRDRSKRNVVNRLFALEEALNAMKCLNLDGYDTVDVEATTFPIDNDLDDEDRKVGLVSVNLRIYKGTI